LRPKQHKLLNCNSNKSKNVVEATEATRLKQREEACLRIEAKAAETVKLHQQQEEERLYIETRLKHQEGERQRIGADAAETARLQRTLYCFAKYNVILVLSWTKLQQRMALLWNLFLSMECTMTMALVMVITCWIRACSMATRMVGVSNGDGKTEECKGRYWIEWVIEWIQKWKSQKRNLVKKIVFLLLNGWILTTSLQAIHGCSPLQQHSSFTKGPPIFHDKIHWLPVVQVVQQTILFLSLQTSKIIKTLKLTHLQDRDIHQSQR